MSSDAFATLFAPVHAPIYGKSKALVVWSRTLELLDCGIAKTDADFQRRRPWSFRLGRRR
jgi:hypothetical protein